VIKTARCTYIVQVNVDSTKVVQDKVPNGIGALDRVRIAVKCLEEPWVSDCVSCRLESDGYG
jgi:hypothetical protein